MKATQFTFIAIAFIFATSCAKEKTADDVTPPNISITLPADGQSYATLDTLWLDAMVTDESEIEDVSVYIKYGADSILIWPAAPVIFGNVNSYHLDDYIVNNITVPAPTPASIVIYATDKRENIGDADVDIELQ